MRLEERSRRGPTHVLSDDTYNWHTRMRELLEIYHDEARLELQQNVWTAPSCSKWMSLAAPTKMCEGVLRQCIDLLGAEGGDRLAKRWSFVMMLMATSL